ncbi:hypothetical protein SEA_CRUNCHYBOI_23 [Microbacterium phage CrunchyBoi]|nr:hypothetical protein SEA_PINEAPPLEPLUTO_23 [Microbacterium phage PineapplePluto]QQO39366.1 hypothetical protein SEA_CRUNCHYBOI_23 [Microbacterium phage CrunchyBoi]
MFSAEEIARALADIHRIADALDTIATVLKDGAVFVTKEN